MTTWHEYVQQYGKLPEWPYPINYEKVNEVTTDVLVIGGGVAGCRAAIEALKYGCSVAIAERGHAKRSGCGGAGVDHWHGAVTNPCSKVTPEMYTKACYDSMNGYTAAHVRYIITKEGWETLQECEDMGVQIRDVNDEFKGADFRDEETKLCFAYDYKNRHIVRVWGYAIKVKAYEEAKRLGAQIHNRKMVTALLTEGGRQGTRVIGATAVDTRTGEFFVFKSKATVICTGGTGRLWLFNPEMTASSSMSDLNASGAGHAVSWEAGAEFVMAEASGHGRLGTYGYAPYSMGNASNTFHGTPIVDAEGKEVPWVDPWDNELKTTEDRFLPQPGQDFQVGIGIGISQTAPEYRLNDITHQLPEKIRHGEFKLPLYADFTRLKEEESRNIFGMMVGNEGKTRIPIYEMMTKAGFNPETDLFQAPVMPPEGYDNANYWGGGINTPVTVRSGGGGGLLTDWNFMTNLPGLFAGAGSSIFGGGCHGESHTTGRYAGRHAALFAKSAGEAVPDSKQVEAEKARAYQAVKQPKSNNGWKEINSAVARIMRDYCGRYKNETTLEMGLRLLNELKTTELAEAYASNPHELGRLLECHAIISCAELTIQASLARKASSRIMDFIRYDYPDIDPEEWHKLLPIRQENKEIKVRDLPVDFHAQAPFADSLEENYRRFSGKREEER